MITELNGLLDLYYNITCRCVNEGGPAHAKRFTFAVRVNTTDKGWTDECIGEPMPSVKKAKDSAAVLLLELINKLYS